VKLEAWNMASGNPCAPATARHIRGGGARPLVLILALAIGAFAVVSGVVGYTLELGPALSIENFVDTIRSWGAWGVLASIGLMIVHSFIPFPAELLACANGMIYGAVWGTVITWTGAMLGAVIAFGLARRLGRPFVERMVARRNWGALDDWAARNGWQVALISRFIPVIAFNLINYAAGLVRMRWWRFIWTTSLGILPLTVLMVVMGDNIESLGWETWLLLLIGGLILWLAVRGKLVKRGV
jgi:uncharacterized membrane protein YdjX (TVP38/TMEM64 family)